MGLPPRIALLGLRQRIAQAFQPGLAAAKMQQQQAQPVVGFGKRRVQIDRLAQGGLRLRRLAQLHERHALDQVGMLIGRIEFQALFAGVQRGSQVAQVGQGLRPCLPQTRCGAGRAVCLLDRHQGIAPGRPP